MAGQTQKFPGFTTAIDDIIDDDTMATASATNVPTSESVVAYVASQSGGGVWAEIGSGQIAGSATATLFDATSISTDYDVFKITFYLADMGAFSEQARLRFNGDTGNNYGAQTLVSNTVTLVGANVINQSGISLTSTTAIGGGEEGTFSILVSKSLTTQQASVQWSGATGIAGTLRTWTGAGSWNNTAAKITQITINSTGGAAIFGIGSFYVIEGKQIT
jgi:hypothetical protein